MSFLSIIVLYFIIQQTTGRPTHVLQDYDKDSKDNSYKDSDQGDSDDYLHSEDKSPLKQFAGDESHTKTELLDENNLNENNEVYIARPDKDYIENTNEEQEDSHLSHVEEQSQSSNNAIKRTPVRNNEIMLFHDNEKLQNMKRLVQNLGDRCDSSDKHSRYFKHDNAVLNIDREASSRDRRQIKNDYLGEPINTEEASTQKNVLITNEDEEAAIRRHVKKLSQEELDELLHSLSEDKRALLKNIIDDSQQENDSINKREITKKTGANEEDSFVGNEHSDASKIQGGSTNLELQFIATDSEKEDNTKKTDIETMSSKIPEIVSTPKCSDSITVLDNIEDEKLVKASSVENLKSSQIEGNPDLEQDTSKKNNKREINPKSSVQSKVIFESPTISDSSNKDFCSENEDLTQLTDDELNLNIDNKHKREVCSDDLDSDTSLEESFPNTNDMNNMKSGLDMTPLIRVKRNNPIKKIEKRDANIVSNIKVPYFSSVLENNEDDSDEANEFEDDGYFDRRANFKSEELATHDTDISRNSNEKYCRNSQRAININKLESDTASLGSDTDVVLSGIEGVDDNIMYNSGARIRRTEETNMEGQIKQENTSLLGTQDRNNALSEENNNAPRYQENDAFGSLPRNYEQDLGRFKRIRRLKPDSNIPVPGH